MSPWALAGQPGVGAVRYGPSDLPMGAYGFRCSLWRPAACLMYLRPQQPFCLRRWSVGDLKLGVAGYQECLSATGGGLRPYIVRPVARPSGRFETRCSGYQDPESVVGAGLDLFLGGKSPEGYTALVPPP